MPISPKVDYEKLNRVRSKLLSVGIAPQHAERLAMQVASGAMDEAQLYAQVEQALNANPADAIDAGQQPETAAIISRKLGSGPTPGQSVDPFNWLANAGFEGIGDSRWMQSADKPSIWMRNQPVPGLSQVQSGSDAGAWQAAGEFLLGGLWSYFDTAFLGLPGLIETGLEKMGVTDKDEFFGWEAASFIQNPETLAGRVGQGLGGFLGFFAPTPIAPAKILGKVGAQALRSEAKLAKATTEAVGLAKPAIEVAKAGEKLSEVGKIVEGVKVARGAKEATFGVKEAKKLIEKGTKYVLGGVKRRGLRNTPKIMQDHETLRKAVSAMDKTDDYVDIIEGALRTESKMGAQYYKDTIDAAAEVVIESAAREGIFLDEIAANALKQSIGQASIRGNPAIDIVTRARSTLGVWAGNAAQHAVTVGAGMAAYKALRYGVIEALKAERYPNYKAAIEDLKIDEAVTHVFKEGFSGLVEGAILGGVKGAIPNLGFREQGQAMKNIHTAMGVSETKAGGAFRAWNQFIKTASFGKAGMTYPKQFSAEHMHKMAETTEGQRRLFEIWDWIKQSVLYNRGKTAVDAIMEQPDIFEAETLSGAKDAKAVADAIVQLRGRLGDWMMQRGGAELLSEFKDTLPRMIATTVALNWRSMFNTDMWREYPGDQVFGILTSAYIGHGSSWQYDVMKTGSTRNMDQIYARQYLAMLGAYSPYAFELGPGGERGALRTGRKFTLAKQLAILRNLDYTNIDPYPTGKNPYKANNVYVSYVDSINSVAKAAENAEQPTLDEWTVRLIENTENILSNINSRVYAKDPQGRQIDYDSWTDAQFVAAGKVLLGHQQTGPERSPSPVWWDRALNRIGHMDARHVAESGNTFVREALTRLGWAPDQIPYIDATNIIENTTNPTEEDLELIRLVESYNEMASLMFVQKKFKPDYDDPEQGVVKTELFDRGNLLKALRAAQSTALDQLYEKADMKMAGDEIGSMFLGLAEQSVWQLSHELRHQVYFEDKVLVTREPVNINGVDKGEIGLNDLIVLYKQTGLLGTKGIGIRPKREMFRGDADKENFGLIDGFADMLVKREKMTFDDSVTEHAMTESQLAAARKLATVLTQLGVETTRGMNSSLMREHFTEYSAKRLTHSGWRTYEMLVNERQIQGKTYYTPYSFTLDDVPMEGGTRYTRVLLSDNLAEGATDKEKEYLQMLAEDLENLINTNLVENVKIITEKEGGEGVWWNRDIFFNQLAEHYSYDDIVRHSESLIENAMSELSMKSASGDISEGIKQNMGRLYSFIRNGTPAQVAEVFNRLRKGGVLRYGKAFEINVENEQRFERALSDALDDVALSARYLDTQSETAQKQWDEAFAHLEQIRTITEPGEDLTARTIASFSRDLKIHPKAYPEIAEAVRTGYVKSPDELRTHVIALGGKGTDKIQDHEWRAMYTSFYNQHKGTLYSVSDGTQVITVDPKTGQQEEQRMTSKAEPTVVGRNPLLDLVDKEYTDKGGHGPKVVIVSQWGDSEKVAHGRRVNIFAPEAGDLGKEFVIRLITGRHAEGGWRQDSAVGNRRIHTGAKITDINPHVLFTGGEGQPLGFELVNYEGGGQPLPPGAKESARFILRYAGHIADKLRATGAIADARLAKVIEAANNYRDAWGPDGNNVEAGMEAYARLMALHMNPSTAKLQPYNINSDISHMFKIGLLMDVAGQDFVRDYLDASSRGLTTDAGKWSREYFKRAHAIVNNNFKLGNKRAAPTEVAKVIEGRKSTHEIPEEWKENDAEYELLENSATGEKEYHYNMTVVRGNKDTTGIFLPNGPIYASPGLMAVNSRSLGAENIAGTSKPQLQMMGFGSSMYVFGKGELGTHDALIASGFHKTHNTHMILPWETAKMLGIDIKPWDMEGMTSSEFGEYIASGSTKHKASIQAHTVKVPFSSIVNMSTPHDGSAGAMASASLGLGYTHPVLLRYFGERAVTIDSRLERQLDHALGIAARAEIPDDPEFIRDANMYILKLLDDTVHTGDNIENISDENTIFEEFVRASKTNNPFRSDMRNQAINLIRKRVLEPAMLKAKNPHGTQSIVQYDLMAGTKWAVGVNETLASNNAQHRPIVPGKTSIAYQIAGEKDKLYENGDRETRYKYVPLTEEGLAEFIEAMAGARNIKYKGTSREQANYLLRILSGNEVAAGFPSEFSDNSLGRLWEILRFVHHGMNVTKTGQFQLGAEPYIPHKMRDERVLKFGIAGPMFRIPKTVTDDTMEGVIVGFNSKLMGNQMIMHNRNIMKFHGDGDGDKVNFMIDASPEVMNELRYIADNSDFFIDDDGRDSDGAGLPYGLKDATTGGGPWQLTDTDSDFEYRKHTITAQRHLGTSISFGQATSEASLRGIQVLQRDKLTGNQYVLRPIAQYKPGEDPRSAYDSYVLSNQAKEVAKRVQMLVSQSGRFLPEEMMGAKAQWYDDLVRATWVRDYNVPGLYRNPDRLPPGETEPISGTDFDVINGVLDSYRGVSNALGQEYIEGRARTRNWDSIVSSVEDFYYSRGAGDYTKNTIMHKKLMSLTGRNDDDARELENAILRAVDYELQPSEIGRGPARGVEVEPTGKARAEQIRRAAAKPDLAARLSDLVRFTRPDVNSTSVVEQVANKLHRKLAEYNRQRGMSAPSMDDAEFLTTVSDYYHSNQDQLLTSRSVANLFDEYQDYRGDRALGNIKRLKRNRSVVLDELRWNYNPRDRRTLEGLLTHYNTQLHYATRELRNVKQSDRHIKSALILKRGRSNAPRRFQMAEDREAFDRGSTGLSYHTVRDQYGIEIDNPEIVAEAERMSNDFTIHRKRMRAAGAKSHHRGYITVPKNILDPRDTGPNSVMTIKATTEEMDRVEYNWMRQIHSAFDQSQSPQIDVFLAMSMAAPKDTAFEGFYPFRTRHGERYLPIYNDPYMKSLQFLRDELGLGNQAQEALNAIEMNKVAMMRKLTTPGALDFMETARHGVTPFGARGHTIWRTYRHGNSALPHAINEFINETHEVDSEGLPVTRPDGRAATNPSRTIKYRTFEASKESLARARIADDWSDPDLYGSVLVRYGPDEMAMPIRKAVQIINGASLKNTRASFIDTQEGRRLRIESEELTGDAKEAALGIWTSKMMNDGTLDVNEELPPNVAELFGKYFMKVNKRTIPRRHIKDIERWAGAMQSINHNYDMREMVVRVTKGYREQARMIRTMPNPDIELAQQIERDGKEMERRLGNLESVMLSSEELKTFYPDGFPFREWIIRTTAIDPYAVTDDLGERLTLDDMGALEKDWVLIREGLRKVRHDGHDASSYLYSTRSFLMRTPYTRELDRSMAMRNQEFMARTSRVNERIKRIKKMVHEASGEHWVTGMLRKVGVKRGVLYQLNILDRKLQDVRAQIQASQPTADREQLIARKNALEQRRSDLEKATEYRLQDNVITMLRGIVRFRGDIPAEFTKDEYGRRAQDIARAYPKLLPIAAEGKLLLNEAHRWMKDGARVLTQTYVDDLVQRMTYGGTPLTPSDKANLQQLKQFGLEIGRIDAYFPFIKPTSIANLNTVYNDLSQMVMSKTVTSLQLDGSVKAVEKFVTDHIKSRKDIDPDFIANLIGSLDTYANTIAAFQYRVHLESEVRHTVNRFAKLMLNNKFNDMYGKGAQDLIDYLNKLQQDGIGRGTDDYIMNALNTMRGLSTFAKIGYSPVTVMKQFSQKLLNWILVGREAMREGKVLLSSTEYSALAEAALDYVPVGFADTSSMQRERVLRMMHGSNTTPASLVQDAVGFAVQKGLRWLKDSPVIGEVAMRREAFAAVFMKTYHHLMHSNALMNIFQNGNFTEDFKFYYPNARTLQTDSKEWFNPETMGGKWYDAFKEYVSYQAKGRAYDMVRAIHFDYSKITKPEFLRNPALAAMFHLRTYDYFHAELFVDSFKQLQYRWMSAKEAGSRMGRGIGQTADEVLGSPEFKFMMRLGAAYMLIGAVSAAVPVGIYTYLRPGALDITANFTDWMLGIRDPAQNERKLEKLFYGKGMLTQLTGPIVSDMIDIINLVAADQIGDPNSFAKYVLGFRDYRTLPDAVKQRKWLNKGSSELSRLTRDGTTLINAAAAGKFYDAFGPALTRHIGLTPEGVMAHEQMASKSVAEFLQSRMQGMPGIDKVKTPPRPAVPGRTTMVPGPKGGGELPPWLQQLKR